MKRLRIFLVAQKEKRGRAEDPDDVHDGIVADEIGINHQGDADEHRLPQAHSLSVHESDEADRAKDAATDQVGGA